MSMQTQHQAGTPAADDEFDVDDPRLSRFDLVREGARRDGVEIVHYAPRFPVPGTNAERRVERAIGLLFSISALGALGFVVAYIWWPWTYEAGTTLSKFYTPVLGFTLALALGGLAFGIITWAKKLLPEEVAVQDRHDGASPDDERKITGATIVNMADELGIQRRGLVVKAPIALAGGVLGIAAAAPLIGGLIKSPHTPDAILECAEYSPDGRYLVVGGRTLGSGRPATPDETALPIPAKSRERTRFSGGPLTQSPEGRQRSQILIARSASAE